MSEVSWVLLTTHHRGFHTPKPETNGDSKNGNKKLGDEFIHETLKLGFLKKISRFCLKEQASAGI